MFDAAPARVPDEHGELRAQRATPEPRQRVTYDARGNVHSIALSFGYGLAGSPQQLTTEGTFNRPRSRDRLAGLQ